MKRLFMMAVVMIAITSAQAYAVDFRSAKWGMTVDQVKASEQNHLKPDEADGSYSHDVKLFKQTATAVYKFINDKFVQGIYEFDFPSKGYTEKYYPMAKKMLKEKYGEATDDFEYGIDFRMSTWQFDDAEVTVTAGTDSLFISYTENNYNSELKKTLIDNEDNQKAFMENLSIE